MSRAQKGFVLVPPSTEKLPLDQRLIVPAALAFQTNLNETRQLPNSPAEWFIVSGSTASPIDRALYIDMPFNSQQLAQSLSKDWPRKATLN